LFEIGIGEDLNIIIKANPVVIPNTLDEDDNDGIQDEYKQNGKDDCDQY
jgi:hypothetical protein